MSTSKEDYLPACNNQGVPHADFQAAWCSRCMNPSCQRSIAGSSLFEKRIGTWQDRLFEHPETLSKEDPRYAMIAAQKFQDIPSGKSLPVVGASPQAPSSSWLDPRDLEKPAGDPPKAKPPRSRTRKAKAQKETPREVTAVPEEAPQQVVESPKSVETTLPAATAPRQGPFQTPFQQGAMLGGGIPPTSSPPKDSWAAPVPHVETARVLKPGGKIRFEK